MSIKKVSGIPLSSIPPYAHFKCNDDVANTVVTDDGTGANNGTSSTNTSNLSVTGKINEAFEFASASFERINIDNLLTDITSDTKGTFAFWAYPTSATSGTIFMFGDTNGNDMLMCYWSATGENDGYWSIEAYVNDLFKWAMSIASQPPNNWYHVVLIQDGVSPKLYINGSDVTNFTNTSDTTWWFNDYTTLDNGRIGCENWYSQGHLRFWDGKIDDFRYYDYALTEDNVEFLYNSGNGTEGNEGSVSKVNKTLYANIAKISGITK